MSGVINVDNDKKEVMIAWYIAYEIMTRSYESLNMFMLHPGGEQYDCLALLSYDGRSFSPKLLITLNGSSIYEANKGISQYQKLYKKNKEALLDKVAHQFEIRMLDSPVRDCTAVSYLMKLSALDYVEVLPAWYDGSYHSKLEDDAMNFPYYQWKTEKEINKHIPWWLIRAKGRTIAMVNLETAMQISEDGLSFDLSVESDKAMHSVMRVILRRDFNAVIDETKSLLNQNDEWRIRYEGYAQKITQNLGFIKSVRESFRQWHPLTVYLNTTSAQNAKKTVGFELRYYGQTVARLYHKERTR